MMLESYYTIAQTGQEEIVVKGSRFICSLQRVHTEEEAKYFIDEIKKEHWKATHHCSAYLIGDQDEIQRAHDDGEPSGTAGVPMLEVLKKNHLHYVVAVVTRYYGGTKLGAGGLIRAYTKSVSTALRTVGIVECSLQVPVSSNVNYSSSGLLENHLYQTNYDLINIEYTDTVTFVSSVPVAEVNNFQDQVIDLMSGNVEFTLEKEQYKELPFSLKAEDDEESQER